MLPQLNRGSFQRPLASRFSNPHQRDGVQQEQKKKHGITKIRLPQPWGGGGGGGGGGKGESLHLGGGKKKPATSWSSKALDDCTSLKGIPAEVSHLGEIMTWCIDPGRCHSREARVG